MAYQPVKRLSALIAKPPFHPTEEQATIIDAATAGWDLVVQAYAGSGKTATAAEIANVLKKRGYFVVFSRAARRDAQHRMPASVQAITSHALAHDFVIKTSDGYARKLANLKNARQGIPPALIVTHLGLKDQPELGASARQQAMAILTTIKAFESSALRYLEPELVPDAAVPMSIRLNGDRSMKDGFIHHILTQSEVIWEAMANERNHFPITHDTYLKLFHLRDPYIPADLWLLDEFQDTTPVFDAIIANQSGQKIYIGDPYQQIFAWRGAINALQGPVDNGVSKYHLTQSWRFNHQVAGAANILLRSLGETVPLKGQNFNMPQMDQHKHHTVLVRNNIRMLSVIGDYLDRRQSVYIPNGLSAETVTKAQSAWALFDNKPDDIKVSAMREIGSWRQFEDVAREMGDQYPEYRDLVSLIRRHGSKLPNILAHAERGWQEIKNDPGRVTLSTTHAAKGKEYGYVALSDDLALPASLVTKLQDGAELTINEREQVHLLYVGITRVKKSLSLAPAIKQNLYDLSMARADDSIAAIGENKRPLSPEEIENRTAAFIAKYRKETTDSASE